MLFQKSYISASLITEMKIIADNNDLCPDIPHEDIPNKIFRHHVCRFLSKRILDQHINPHLFDDFEALFFRIDQRLLLSCQKTHGMKIKGEHNRLKSFFAIRFQLVDQKLVSPMQPIKLSQSHYSMIKMDILSSSKINHDPCYLYTNIFIFFKLFFAAIY